MKNNKRLYNEAKKYKTKANFYRLMSHLTFGQIHDWYRDKYRKSYAKFEIENTKLKSLNNTENSIFKDYVDTLFYDNMHRKDKFVNITNFPIEYKDNDTKIIAYYLPQYYQIDVNDKFHGTGFTEWTKSTQAIPMYTSHEQPHLPYDVGFYNLLNIDSIKRQVELAKMYGIYGFCIHWYWFSGARTMEKPLELLLKHPEIDMPFCLNWATENWTALWDGGNNEMIFEQKLQDDDDEKLFNDLLPYFKDKRYIKIDGKPLFSIYNVFMFEKERLALLIKNLRKYAARAGLKGLYITLTNSGHFHGDVAEYGADALQEFAPSCLQPNRYFPKGFISPAFCGGIYDYAEMVQNKKIFYKYDSAKYFRSAMVAFDNTARKAYGSGCCIYHGATPELFQKWLTDILRESKQIHAASEDIVFINNWNEWAEGSHLEPDMRYGYANLQAVANAVRATRPVDTHIIENKIKSIKDKSKIEFYVSCVESFGDIVACEPIARWLRQAAPKCKIHWIVKKQYHDLVAFNPNIDEVIDIDCLSDTMDICEEKSKNKNNIIIDCHYDGRWDVKTGRIHRNPNNPQVNEKTYFNYGSILETFCLSAGMPALKDAPVFHLKKKVTISTNLPQKYIVMHCKSAETIKDWSDERWNTLASDLIKQGFDIVEIGMQKTLKLNSRKYHDCTDITDFQQLAKIISNATLFTSVDSGFAHIANCYNVPSCIIMGKYKTFDNPMPYTGFLYENKDKYIIYANQAPASTISEQDVLDNILKTLGDTK